VPTLAILYFAINFININMRHVNSFCLLLICLMVPFLYACPGKGPNPKTKTELIQRNWKVRQVTANGNTVYIDPPVSTPNSQNYSGYRLHFTSASNFSRTDIGGTTTVTGTWQFDNKDNPTKIIFTPGNPDEVALESLSENSLVISYVVESTKTGRTTYEISLIPAL
jgi:hypothetical protein